MPLVFGNKFWWHRVCSMCYIAQSISGLAVNQCFEKGSEMNTKTIPASIFSLLLLGIVFGCDANTLVLEQPADVGVAVSKVNSPATTSTPVTSPIKPAEPAAAKIQEQEKESKGLFGKARDLYDKSKKVTEMSNKAQQWLSDTIDETGAADAGEDAMDWANNMFKSLKDQGLTTAGTAQEWLSEDLKNMNGFQYKVIRLTASDSPEKLEKELNQLGSSGWECFHVSENSSTQKQTMFFKKAKNSYLKKLPVRDMLRLIPLMGGGDEG